jgi:hypothetical protein
MQTQNPWQKEFGVGQAQLPLTFEGAFALPIGPIAMSNPA